MLERGADPAGVRSRPPIVSGIESNDRPLDALQEMSHILNDRCIVENIGDNVVESLHVSETPQNTAFATSAICRSGKTGEVKHSIAAGN